MVATLSNMSIYHYNLWYMDILGSMHFSTSIPSPCNLGNILSCFQETKFNMYSVQEMIILKISIHLDITKN